MNTKTRTLALTAILIAITLVLGLTPIGFIAIPGLIEVTLMCLPVIVGSLVLGWRAGVVLGAVFALTSIITAITRSPLGSLLLDASVVKTLILLIIPRLLFPIVAFFVYKIIHAKRDGVNIGVAAAAGSATNTVVFLVLLAWLFPDLVAGQVFTFAALVNGTIEAALATFVCVPVVSALKKSVPPLTPNRQILKEKTVQ